MRVQNPMQHKNPSPTLHDPTPKFLSSELLWTMVPRTACMDFGGQESSILQNLGHWDLLPVDCHVVFFGGGGVRCYGFLVRVVGYDILPKKALHWSLQVGMYRALSCGMGGMHIHSAARVAFLRGCLGCRNSEEMALTVASPAALTKGF